MQKPELTLDDTFASSHFRGSKSIKTVEYKKAYVVKESDNEERLMHADGSMYSIMPFAIESLPQSICLELLMRPDITVISESDAKRFIQMASEHARKMNMDIIAFNEMAKKQNEANRGTKDFRPIQLKKWRKGAGVTKSPYAFFVEERDAGKVKEPTAPSPIPVEDPEKAPIKDKKKHKEK